MKAFLLFYEEKKQQRLFCHVLRLFICIKQQTFLSIKSSFLRAFVPFSNSSVFFLPVWHLFQINKKLISGKQHTNQLYTFKYVVRYVQILHNLFFHHDLDRLHAKHHLNVVHWHHNLIFLTRHVVHSLLYSL